ncbi:MAG: hypothetical protein GZ088_01790 [Acidipila sp.]|nr:hypothetical protein [Acidipila sp.]
MTDPSGSLTTANSVDAAGWRPVQPGLSWNAQFPDLRDYAGVAWYKVSFVAPQFSQARRALLHFGAVDYFSEVFVNGKPVGQHEGGYTPFSFDVTEAVRPGANQVLVRVVDPPMNEAENRARFPKWMYNEIPHGKQNWYVQTGGIWQPVSLEFRPSVYIERVHVTPQVNGDFKIEVRLAGSRGNAAHAIPLDVFVRDESGHADFHQTLQVGSGPEQTVTGHINSPRLWSPDHPVLYSVEIALAGSEGETVYDRFGFRSFEARNGMLYLNGEPFYMRAALDQDFYPEGVYTPPSERYVREMMRRGKRLGLNMLRCHIKVPDPLYLRAADEVGMLVWYEIPSWNDAHHFAPVAAERGEQIFAAMVDRDWNHPSIVIQSVINEAWGSDLKQQDQRAWLRAAFERAKQLTAPLGRVIDDNSACCENFHIKSDLADFHQYYSIPDNSDKWDKWTADFASRPKWIFSPFGDAKPTGREPLIVSEFGNWGLPKLPQEWPWWYGRDFEGREVTRPAGVLGRFQDFRLDHIFNSFDSLAEESQWHQFLSLKHEIEDIRSHSAIQGYVITEFTDINWEANGLMDMWRQPKVYATELAHIQQADAVLGQFARHNFQSGENVELDVKFSHYGENDLRGAWVTWFTDSGASGRYQYQHAIQRGDVTALQHISFPAAAVEKPQRQRVHLEVRGPDGALLAENHYDYFVFPNRSTVNRGVLKFHDPARHLKELGQSLLAAGYSTGTADTPDAHTVMLAARYDAQVEAQINQGGRVVLLIDSIDALPAGTSLKVAAHDGSDLDGNWVTNFNWVRANAAPFDAVAFGRLLGLESASVVPHYIIQGVAPHDYDDVLSGVFYGWLNQNAALAVQMNAGKGKLLATTFRFDAYGKDPYATQLLDSILRYAASPGFMPRLNVVLDKVKE